MNLAVSLQPDAEGQTRIGQEPENLPFGYLGKGFYRKEIIRE
jgi:hypothetical protein